MRKYVPLVILLWAITLLTGCALADKPDKNAGRETQETVSIPATRTDVWEAMPTLTYGTMDADKLAVLEWNDGRCEVTSFYRMAETEQGYYFLHDMYKLYYADKSAPDQWVPVCNRPDCDHWNSPNCDAHMESHAIVVKDGRIYFEQNTGHHGISANDKSGTVLASMAYDGSDRKLEYVLEEALWGREGGINTVLSAQHWLCSTYTLQPDGSGETRFFRVTEDGVTEYPLENAQGQHTALFWGNTIYLYGDPYLEIDSLDGDNNFASGMLYWLDGEEIRKLDTSVVFGNISYAGGYVSGNTLRTFRQNDGYYDRDLTTGEEVKLTNPRLENSIAYMVLPNCIIETTLYESATARDQGMTHEMELFDGEGWHSISLPAELEEAPEDVYLTLCGVTSDSILFSHKEEVTEIVDNRPVRYVDIKLYRIQIGEDWSLEYFGTVQQPRKSAAD